ncbi:choline O-acetyltransferase-like isoform X2 [Patiria miniata]|uniref:Choline O-acetyltransferase n=1 Tax=Patiria miniata TaxID=46514 RepID=A0A914A977_PATMI|nr:choline O-acetyltransferase-like isoform X2 [Patiria miniata]
MATSMMTSITPSSCSPRNQTKLAKKSSVSKSKPLPRLPVPPLHNTLAAYLQSLRATVSREQYAITESLVREFGRPGGPGEYLQMKLLEYAESQANWSNRWWLDDMYLHNHVSLPLNSNPGMVFPKQHFKDEGQRLRFAAKLISGILDYKVIIDARALPVDRVRHHKPGQPLCMEQYYRLFSSYRVPGVVKDSLVSPSSSVMPEPEHIIVVCNNQFFVLDVIVNFKRLSEQDLLSQLKRIVDLAREDPAPHTVGLLTTMGRVEWATARKKLIKASTNRDSLDMIERCIFVLCLDANMGHPPAEVGKPMDADDEPLAHQMLHGGGTSLNSGNRWFDKTMQFIIGDDGTCGLNYEHSPSEGVAVVQLVEHLLRYIDSETHKRKLTRAQSICELPCPRVLRWKLSHETIQDIETARGGMDRLVDDFDLKLLRYTKFGKGFPKSQNMSPDAFIQIALQFTYFRIYGHLTSTYESASTRRFLEGRVDNIRAATVEALEFSRSMIGDRQATELEKMDLLRAAIQRQTDICITNILGQGFDCHLLGLRELSRELGEPMPEIFTDEAYRMSNYFNLSTSQVLTKLDTFMCYGAVVPDGYGAAYNPHEDYILFAIASWKRCPTTSSEVFRDKLYKSLNDMHALCTRMSLNNNHIVK